MTDAEASISSEPGTPQTPSPAPGGQARAHRVLVPTLFVLATVIGFVGAFAVWTNRQALNTDNWTDTSTKLLANQQIDDALGTYLVNQLFTSVDVAAELQSRLPPQTQGLAGPAAAGLQQLAERAAPELLARPRVQELWRASNKAAHKQFLQVINGGGSTVSTNGGNVTLNVHSLVTQLATSLGIQSQVAAAQAKLKSSSGQSAKKQAQQKLGITLPASTGQLVILRSDQLSTAQDIAKAIKGLAIVLPLLTLALFALAVWLARGRRRQALRTTGWCVVAIGVLLLLIRRIAGNAVVNGLVKVQSNRPAMHEVWSIATSLLYAIAVAMVVYGLIVVLCAWLAGPTRPARFLRQLFAPPLRDHSAAAYGLVGGVLLLVVLWGPTPAFRKLVPVLLIAALLALGVTVLRRQTALEFPNARQGDALHGLGAAWQARRATAAAPPAPDAAVDELERLAALHDSGALTDQEFGAQKTLIVNRS